MKLFKRILVTLSVSLTMLSSTLTASAHSYAVPRGFDHPAITCRINNDSTYYQKVWKQAIKNWNHSVVIYNAKGKRVPLLKIVSRKRKADITVTAMNKYNWGVKDVVGVTTRQTIYEGKDIRGHLNKAIARISINHMNWGGFTTRERINNATHELGHALGLKHNSDYNSVMYYMTRYQHISYADRRNLQLLINRSL